MVDIPDRERRNRASTPPAGTGTRGWRGIRTAFYANRLLLIGAALVFAALALLAELDPVAAGIGFAAVAALALWRRDRPGRFAATPAQSTRQGDSAALAGVLALVDALPQAAFLIDDAGAVVAENAAARRLFGPVTMGDHIATVLRAPDVLSVLDQARATGSIQVASYFERVPVNRWLEARAAPLAFADGRRSLALLMLEDLTRQQQMEKVRADFVANASHELRTPLASLLGFVETLQGSARDDPDARARFLEIMRGQAMRMSRLISDLMSLSRIESNAHVMPERTVDLRPVLGHVRDALAVVADAAGVVLVLDIADDLDMSVAGEPDELTQVFQNLIENAIKYGQAGKRVEVSARSVPSAAGGGAGRKRIDIAIRDYGPGIAAEHVPRLTERFYRVDVATSRQKGGTGLGLAIVKHILNRHRARLEIDSTVGEGSTFTVRFDVAGAD